MLILFTWIQIGELNLFLGEGRGEVSSSSDLKYTQQILNRFFIYSCSDYCILKSKFLVEIFLVRSGAVQDFDKYHRLKFMYDVRSGQWSRIYAVSGATQNNQPQIFP